MDRLGSAVFSVGTGKKTGEIVGGPCSRKRDNSSKKTGTADPCILRSRLLAKDASFCADFAQAYGMDALECEMRLPINDCPALSTG